MPFAPGIEVEFTNRENALKRITEWAERGIVNVQVVFGPEGCGKTAWLKQSAVLLREQGFDVIYINPVEREFFVEIGVEDVKKRLLDILRESSVSAWVKAVDILIVLGRELLRAGRKKLAILADDIFQVIGLSKAAMYVKGLLGLIEYPPRSYERIVTVVATSEGLSRREIGRHRWADILPIWNMPEGGFKHLYEKLPGDKPGFEEVWRITGGNPKLLTELYQRKWDVSRLVNELIRKKDIGRLVESLSDGEKKLLAKAVDDPDTLMCREGIPLMDRLVELNLIVDNMYERDPWFWIDVPPPEKDPELGIGKEIAWQTPLHREAIRDTLKRFGNR